MKSNVLFSCVSATMGRIFLKIRILNTTHVRYNDVSLTAISQIIQTTVHEEQCNLSAVPRIPLERFS
jgi:hypothetical protein